jgi:hypothetical protein
MKGGRKNNRERERGRERIEAIKVLNANDQVKD